MPQIGPLEIAVVLLIALLVFGPNRLPELARQVGGALRELRKIQNNLRADLHEMMSDDPSAGGSPPPTLPPKAGEVVDVTGEGLPPTGVPTSGSGEDAGPASPADADITDSLVAGAAAETLPPPPPPPPEAD
jgi:TatA/E family protein of Tat protein translocase